MAKYHICKPTARNRETNNYCVTPEQLFDNKDFLFKFDDNTEVIVPHNKIIEYQQTHPMCWCKGFPVYDDDGVFKRYVANVRYLLIPTTFILQFK